MAILKARIYLLFSNIGFSPIVQNLPILTPRVVDRNCCLLFSWSLALSLRCYLGLRHLPLRGDSLFHGLLELASRARTELSVLGTLLLAPSA